MKEKLSQPLARHGELACGFVRTDSGCGFLNTETVEIIYNDEESSATLFLNPQWSSAFNSKSLYLNPDKNTVNAFIHQQDINVLVQDDYQSLSIQGNGALGITENSYIGAHWNFDGYDADDVSDNNVDVSDLYYRYDFYAVIMCRRGGWTTAHYLMRKVETLLLTFCHSVPSTECVSGRHSVI